MARLDRHARATGKRHSRVAKLREMRAKDETAPPTEIELLTEIRDALVAGKGSNT